MRTILIKLRNCTLYLKLLIEIVVHRKKKRSHFNFVKAIGIVAVFFITIGISACSVGLESNSNNDKTIDETTALHTWDSQNKKGLDKFTNYDNRIETERITSVSIDGERYKLFPINDFSYHVASRHFIFYIVNDEETQIIEMLDSPTSLREEKRINTIDTIVVADFNNDNLDDILIVFSYPIGFGKFAGAILYTYEIYLQTTKTQNYYVYEEDLSAKINDIVENETKLLYNYDEVPEEDYIPDLDFVVDLIRASLTQ